MKYDKEELIKSVEEQLEAGMSEKYILNRLAEAGLEPIDARLLYIKAKTLMQVDTDTTRQDNMSNGEDNFEWSSIWLFIMMAVGIIVLIIRVMFFRDCGGGYGGP